LPLHYLAELSMNDDAAAMFVSPAGVSSEQTPFEL
jgi:hypothetical protein